MKIAITGATGFVARGLVPRLKQAGHTVLLAGRDAAALRTLYPDDAVCDYTRFAEQTRGYDRVIHTAVLNNDAQGDIDAFRAVNVQLACDLAHQPAQAGVPLFVNLTTFHAIEPPFKTLYAQSKHEGEVALNAVDGIRVVHLRLPAIYAEQFRGKLAPLNRLPAWLRKPLFLCLASLRPTLHINALANAVMTGPLDDGMLSDGQQSNPIYGLLNRLMDLGFAVAVIIFLWWLLLGAWIAVRLTSPGSAIFAQPRVGRKGRVFTCYKFRTMQAGTKEAATHEVSASAITPTGHFLRRTRIDELPQIINILRNEMSLVGPRPCLPSQHELIACRQRLGVLEAKPGITGLAQVKGVDMSDPEKLAKLDAAYITRRSVLLDIAIVLATIRGKGAKDYVSQPA